MPIMRYAAAAAAVLLSPALAAAACFTAPRYPYPLLLYADGVTISFAPDQQDEIVRKYGPDADTRIPQVMKLSCHYDPKGNPKIVWPIDQKTICEKTTITIGGQSCAIESIGAATLNDLPDVERVVKMEDDGSSGLASAPWLLGWHIKKH
jgi:hypothetical protein